MKIFVFAFFLSVWLHFGWVKCYLLPNNLPSILKEFRIIQPLILNYMLERKEIIQVVKNLNYHGYSSGFSYKQFDPYQSCIIFRENLTEFKWNNPTYTPIVVVSKMETMEDLKEVHVSIGGEVLFLDSVSLKVYESYTINRIQINRYLGQFHIKNTSDEATFVPFKEFSPSMENRRGNFFGMQLTGGIFLLLDDPENYLNLIKFIPQKNVYDVTNLVGNPEYSDLFYGMVEGMILKLMETKFNFTSKLFSRKDKKQGSPHVLSNGSTVIDKEGIFQDLMEGSIEFVWDPFIMLPIRLLFVDFLSPMRSSHDAIFIPIEDSSEETDWNVFLGPFGTEVWIAIVIKCVILSILVSIIEWFHGYKLFIHSVIYKILTSFTSNFGVAPLESNIDHIISYRTFLFSSILDGLILWISYQSFLYPYLSTVVTKDPFNDLDSLAKSGYMLYTGPKDSSRFNILSSTQVYEKVMNNNVDLELSFHSWGTSIEKTLNTSKSAIFADSQFLDWPELKDRPCMFKPVWNSQSPIYSSVMMRKGSQFTRIFAQEIRRLASTGHIDFLKKRISERFLTCKPQFNEKSLGYEKLSFLFLIIILGYIMSILVLFLESNKHKLTSKRKQVSLIEEKIEEYLDSLDLSNQQTEKVFHELNKKCFNNG